MIQQLLKALFYACSSGPKIAAPHKLSLHGDYEACVLSAFSALEAVQKLFRRLEQFSRGEIALGDIGVGTAMSEAISYGFRELGARMPVEIVLTAPLVAAILWFRQSGGHSIADAVNTLNRALVTSRSEESALLVSSLRRVGGEVAWYIEQADLSERRVKMDGLSVYDVFSALSTVSQGRFSFVVELSPVSALAAAAISDLREGAGVNEALTRAFVSIAYSRGYIPRLDVPKVMSSRDVLTLLKLDNEYRKRGLYLVHLVPYVMAVSIELVVQGY